MSEIAKWYSNKSVFLTGATGFVGKCLVVKLLYDCPDITTIYIIIRPKKGLSCEDRIKEYKNHVVFSRLKEKCPSAMDKIHIVEGDMSKPNLGMSDANRKLVAETASIIFHSAADVRFDRRLIDAYNTNVRGAKSLLEFATEFKHLLAFVLVSTAFSQTLEVRPLEEKHYESSIHPDLIQRLVENVNEDILDMLTPKLLGEYPNTYAYTKSVVEQLVYDYSDKLPTGVARPPIVVSAWREPLAGYTEGIHGTNGWSLASGHGLLRTMLCVEDYPCNVMPADTIVNGIVILGYECGRQHEARLSSTLKEINDENIQRHDKEGPIYFNLTEEHPLSWKLYVETLLPNYLKYPFDIALWYPGGSFKTSRFFNFLSVLFFQILPALLIDFLLLVFRQKPVMLKIQRIISTGCDTLYYYQNNLFVFKAGVYNAVRARLSEKDREIFYDRATMDMNDYCDKGAYGTRLYLVKGKPENIPKAKRLMQRLWYLDVATKSLVTYWLLKKLITYFNITLY